MEKIHVETKRASGDELIASHLEPVDLFESYQILYVDDDPIIRQMVGDYLVRQDMRVAFALKGEDVMRRLANESPGLVILDLRLGNDDGLDLLRAIRERSDVPVIITTGHRRDEIDRVIGLELGADDYVIKPFGLRELLARIRALLRRQRMTYAVIDRNVQNGRFRFGEWQLDRRTRRLTDRWDSQVILTKGEYTLLIAFLESPQRPLSREYLLQATRVHEDVFDRSIDVQVLRLRRKLENEPNMPRIIKTERGIGYTFALKVTRVA
jgi:two-component system, OmpR family, response regulator